jgi:hypothetical protein
MEIRKFSTRNEGMKVFGSKEEGKEDHPGSDGGMEGLRIRTASCAAGGIVHSGSRGTKRAAKSTPGGPSLGKMKRRTKLADGQEKGFRTAAGKTGHDPAAGGRKIGRIRAKNRPKTHRPGTESLRKKSAPEKGRLQVRG